ncbi:MAG: erythromycin esterase family protein [Candidatus Eisenbacteria bacterium]|nr:erythromycin esterase family protein [Candidatus Eisenbacteria bacterium]
MSVPCGPGIALASLLLLACAEARTGVASDEAMNLGFEEMTRGLPSGWARGERGTFEVVVDSTIARTGRHSIRITSDPEGYYGSLSRRIDAGPLVGKRVRLHGWARAEAVTGWAVVWIRVDGGQATYVMADGPLGTSTDWSEMVADAMIAAGEDLTFGVALGGDGTAWFDDLELEVVEPAPLVPIRFAGRVVDSTGAPVGGAEVALIDAAGTVAQHVRTTGDGGFDLEAVCGEWALSANAPGRPALVGAFLDARAYAASTEPTLVLGADSSVIVQGRVEGVSERAYVRVAASSTHTGDVWAVPFDAEGKFATALPLADRFGVSMISGGVGTGSATRTGDVATAELEVVLERPTPPAVLEWISHHAIPLDTTDPEVPLEDPTALRALVGSARVVALGEATHGTREFFRLKHRIFRALIPEGFNVFALEIGQVEARAINDYVLEGKGDARSTLGRAGMWVWETEEVLDLIEWMRAWNAEPSHTPELRFVGFDMQSSIAAFEAVEQFLAQLAPEDGVAWLAPLEVLRSQVGIDAFLALSKERQAEVVAAAGTLVEQFDASRPRWEAATSPAAFAVARQDARVLQQAAVHFSPGEMTARGSELRDEAMAENIKWLRDQLSPGERMVVSAHNLHVADVPGRMGKPLRATLGSEWLSIGLQLGDGTFQALGARTDGAARNIEAFTFSPPPAGLVNATLLAAGPEVYALDLRAVPSTGEVADWFRSPQLVREVGYVFRSEAALTGPQVLTERFDALLFVAHSTRARPLPIDFSRLP